VPVPPRKTVCGEAWSNRITIGALSVGLPLDSTVLLLSFPLLFGWHLLSRPLVVLPSASFENHLKAQKTDHLWQGRDDNQDNDLPLSTVEHARNMDVKQ
jgi:hypothetical protein